MPIDELIADLKLKTSSGSRVRIRLTGGETGDSGASDVSSLSPVTGLGSKRLSPRMGEMPKAKSDPGGL